MKAKIAAIFLFVILCLAGCISEYETDSDEGKGVITDGSGLDKKKQYTVISSHMMKMTSEAWSVSGTAYELRRDTALGDCEGEYTRQTGDLVEFEGRIVIPVRERLNMTFDENLEGDSEGDATVITSDIMKFYSEDGILIAEADTATGQVISRISSDEKDSGGWPSKTKTGEFDLLQEMTYVSTETKRSSVWYLDPTTEGNANFIIKAADRKKDSSEAEIVEERTDTINTDGDIILKKIKLNDLEKRYRIEINLTRM